MFYILLCFYLWIYGTLNKISYNISQMTVLEESGILIINMRRTSGCIASNLHVSLFISVTFIELGLCWIVLLAANHLYRLCVVQLPRLNLFPHNKNTYILVQ